MDGVFRKIFFAVFLFPIINGHAGEGVPNQDEFWNTIKGSPRIIHYTRKDFNGDPQFWTMCEGSDGVFYFGNNDGALVFDGARWTKIILPNNSSVRSLLVSKDGTIYAAGFNDFGRIVRDSFGQYKYESMVNLLRPEDRGLENIWQIHEVQGHIVFRTFKKLIALTGEKALTLPALNYFGHAAVINDTYYILDDEGTKSLDFHSLEFRPIIDNEDLLNEELSALLPGTNDNRLFALTKQGSLYSVLLDKHKAVLDQRLIPVESRNLITCGIRSSKGLYYIGTLSSQVIVLDGNGERLLSHPVQNLQDNTVLNLVETQRGNVWVMLNNGIDCIDLSSPVSLLFENASIFDVVRQGDKLYVATNQGVFVSGSGSGGGASSFVKIDGTEGQAWSLHEYRNQVLCCHDRGLFVLSGTTIKKDLSVTGIWKVIPLKGRKDRYLVCTYEGLHVLDYTRTQGFVIRHKLEGFNESTRDILESDTPGVFWVCHGYKGVFRIKIDDALQRVVSVEHFKDQNGLPSPFNINVFRWKNEIVFTTNQGIYTYNEGSNEFKIHPFLTGLFGKTMNVRKLLEHGDKTWFVHDDEVGYFKTTDKNPALEKGLFLQLKGTFNRSMECIVPIDDSHALVGTNTGLYYYDLRNDFSGNAVNTVLSKTSYQEDSGETLCSLVTSPGSPQLFPNRISGIRFEFAAPQFPGKLNIQYSYWLKGLEEDWSPWQDMSFKEYNSLRPGHYVFHV
ncbi:MAG TPA: triple tyrosine motif-containing protein, partial [Cyclobacteriaceae bacterium]|nr:triple tyrosine motif-containing protein [Cyclobacteriaceae bacterium]